MQTIHESSRSSFSLGGSAENSAARSNVVLRPRRLSTGTEDAIRTTLNNPQKTINVLTDSYEEISKLASKRRGAPVSQTDVDLFIREEKERVRAQLQTLNIAQWHQSGDVYNNFVTSYTSSAAERRKADELYAQIMTRSYPRTAILVV